MILIKFDEDNFGFFFSQAAMMIMRIFSIIMIAFDEDMVNVT